MRLVRGILAAIGLVGALLTQAEAQGVRIHMHVDGGYAADGELYTPSGDPPFAAVLLIPDERGLTQRVTDAAASLAEAGFEAVAVDLNRGLSADAAQHSDEQARHDLAAALAFLSLQTTVRAQDIGAFGWGSGGRYAL
jgi:carboxymethylenebutenolidase